MSSKSEVSCDGCGALIENGERFVQCLTSGRKLNDGRYYCETIPGTGDNRDLCLDCWGVVYRCLNERMAAAKAIADAAKEQ